MALSESGANNAKCHKFWRGGDAVQFFANTMSNSVVVTTANQFSSADIGKVIELFGAGPLGTSTNHQDLLSTINNVVNATNLSSRELREQRPMAVLGIYGTNNATAFQACINAAPSNSIINIPNGTYLIVGSQALDPNFVMANMFETHPSIVIQKGGLSLSGQSESGTVLLGCGAWQNKGSYAYRGHMFGLTGPVTNNGPLIFVSLTIDGGVQQGFTGYTGCKIGIDVSSTCFCSFGLGAAGTLLGVSVASTFWLISSAGSGSVLVRFTWIDPPAPAAPQVL